MLSLKKISKSFPGVKALEDVTLDVRAGEIHALVGENGAGKSTLTRVIAGVYQPDEGVIGFDGNDVKWAKPGDAKQAGIHVIYQEFVLFQHLSVAENIFIGYERRNRFGLIDHRKAAADAKKLLERFGLDLDPKALVKDLSVADQQMVEIAKALVHDVKLLILDEPTAVISGHEVEQMTKARYIYYKKVGEGDSYEMDHTAGVQLVRADGRFFGTLDSHETAEIRMQKIRRLIGE